MASERRRQAEQLADEWLTEISSRARTLFDVATIETGQDRTAFTQDELDSFDAGVAAGMQVTLELLVEKNMLPIDPSVLEE